MNVLHAHIPPHTHGDQGKRVTAIGGQVVAGSTPVSPTRVSATFWSLATATASAPVPPTPTRQPAFTGIAKVVAETIVLTVINNGSDPITIKTIGFTAADEQRGRTYLDFLESWRNPGKAALPATRGTEALLPDRIEGHDCRIYEYSEDALKALPAGEYRGYAERYKSFRVWPKCNRSTVRKTI
jgi:hypothetical protein